MTATEAITRSITHNEIVHIPVPSDDDISVLLRECDDNVHANDVTEYWGTDEGESWRVHTEEGTKHA